MAVKDMKNDELVDHYYELKHLNADDAETAKYYKELVCEMAERFAIMVENESLNCNDSGNIQLILKDNGKAQLHDSTWDIIIYCENEEEQKHAMELLEKFNEQEPILDLIKEEIENTYYEMPSNYNHMQRTNFFLQVIKIIDRYKAESEVSDG